MADWIKACRGCRRLEGSLDRGKKCETGPASRERGAAQGKSWCRSLLRDLQKEKDHLVGLLKLREREIQEMRLRDTLGRSANISPIKSSMSPMSPKLQYLSDTVLESSISATAAAVASAITAEKRTPLLLSESLFIRLLATMWVPLKLQVDPRGPVPPSKQQTCEKMMPLCRRREAEVRGL